MRWENSEDANDILDSVTLKSRNAETDVVLAVTGDAFRYAKNDQTLQQFEAILMKACIFARMSPDEKKELVEAFQELDYTTCFCGDGANDCGALKAANVGISLSEAEASVAAPFTSQVFDISCVVELIKEGRCALVTSFACFKYMSLYSAIQFLSVTILYSLGSNLGDFQFLYIDLFLIIPIAVFMSWAKPFPVLSSKRPTANLVSRKVIISLLGEIVILGCFQFTVWQLVRKQNWYFPPLRLGDNKRVASSENTVLFLISCFQYIFIAALLSAGPPYRQPMSKNKPLMITITVTVLSTLYLMSISATSPLGRFMDLSFISQKFKFDIVMVAGLNALVSWTCEIWVFPTLSSMLRPLLHAIGIPIKRESNKRYKRLQVEAQYFRQV